MATDQGEYSIGVNRPGSKKIGLELDGIADDGFIQEIKTSRVRPPDEVPDALVPVDEYIAAAAPPPRRARGPRLPSDSSARFDKDVDQIARQLEFANETGLRGVRVETDNPMLKDYYLEMFRRYCSRELENGSLLVDLID